MWKEYNFADLEKPSIGLLRGWFEQRFPGKMAYTDIVIPSEKSYGPEQYLETELKKFYAGLAADAARTRERPLAILIYCGHAGYGPTTETSFHNTPNLTYIPRNPNPTDSLDPRAQQQLFWSDAADVPGDQYPKAIIDFNYVWNQVQRPRSVVTWFIMSACYAGYPFVSDITAQKFVIKNTPPVNDRARAMQEDDLRILSEKSAVLLKQRILDVAAGKLSEGSRASEGPVHYWCEVGLQGSKPQFSNFFQIIRSALEATVSAPLESFPQTGARRRFGAPGTFRIKDVWNQIPHGDEQQRQADDVDESAPSDFERLINLRGYEAEQARKKQAAQWYKPKPKPVDDPELRLPFYTTDPRGWEDQSLVQPAAATRRFNAGGPSGRNPEMPSFGDEVFADLNIGR